MSAAQAVNWERRMAEQRGEYHTGAGATSQPEDMRSTIDGDTPRQWFAMVPATVIRDRRITSGVRDVLSALLIYADKDGTCWPSQKRIADDLGISREEVNRRMRRLKDVGYLTIEPPKTKAGPAIYHIHLSPLSPTCDETVTPCAQPVMKRSLTCDETVTQGVTKRSHRTYPYNKPSEQREREANASCPTPDGADAATVPPPQPSQPAQPPKAAKPTPAKTLPEESDAVRLAAYLRDHILAHSPNARDAKAAQASAKLQQWARPIDLMLRIDGRTPDGIRAVIDFATTDSFWQSNILSPGKLRDQYDRLEARMRNQHRQPAYANARAAPATANREPPAMRLNRDRPLNAKPAKLD